MNKIPSASQNTEAKTLPTDFCIIGRFGQLSPAAVHSCFIHCHIFMQKLFLLCWNSCKQCSKSSMHFWSTVSKCSSYLEHNFLIDKCSCKMVNTLPSDIFNSSVISCNFNLRLTKTILWSFFCIFWDNCQNLGDLSIQHHLCLYNCIQSQHTLPLNHCFWQSRVWKTLIKPLLCLNHIFSP